MLLPMYRILLALLFVFGLTSLTAFRIGNPEFGRNPLAYNTPTAHYFYPETRIAPAFETGALSLEPDTLSRMRVLMLDYSEYGSAYNEKVSGIISQYLPKASISNFSDGSADELGKALSTCDAVVIAYPSAASPATIKNFSKTLQRFVQQGGSLIFTGTHEFEILQQFGLIELDFGYFSKDMPVHELTMDHPLFQGVSTDFTMTNFTYPLDVSDPGFVSLAEVGGYPAIGFKPIGNGKVLYLGIEYYYDEDVSSRILINALYWVSGLRQVSEQATVSNAALRASKRSEEFLYAGTGNVDAQIDLKVYPNPYYSKANLDIELSKPTQVRVEMTDEMGRSVAVVFPKKLVSAGLCRFELPNVSPGIYFLQVQVGDQRYMRKVVKSASN